MKRTLKVMASLSALLAAFVILVADSTNERCGIVPGVDVTYGFDTDCMGTSTSGRIHLRRASETGGLNPSGSDLGYAPLSDSAIAEVRAGGLNVYSVDVRFDLSACQLDEGIGNPVGFSFIVHGVPAGDPVTPPHTTLFECEKAGALSENADLGCASLAWVDDGAGGYRPGDMATGQTCRLSLTFVE